MKTPITYYGGKQKMLKKILPLIPDHNLYCEPFVGGGAVFWGKPPSRVEVINDTNRELINFYDCVKNHFIELEQMIRISLHSRSLHHDAMVVNNNPHMFTPVKRAWAVWVLASQSYSSKLDGTWGYDVGKASTSVKIANKREIFTEEYAQRLQNVQIENTDALRIINSRDRVDSFFYCDPPYFNSDCGHYDGYSEEDFENLLKALSKLEGKFLLSSYPSAILTRYIKEYGWSTKSFELTVSVANATRKPGKRKVEVLTANFNINGGL